MFHSSLTQKRKHIRVRGNPLFHAQIDPRPQAKEFLPELVALVTTESYAGAGLVLTKTDDFQLGDRIQIEITESKPRWAEVVWRERLDPDVLKLGIRYIT